MIYTVTMNPSLDYSVSVDSLVMGQTNRTSSEKISAGGKGINVSIVLKNLGVDSVLLGFVAGFTGREIKKRLTTAGLTSDFTEIKNEMSRINIKIKSEDGTEINAKGPRVDEKSVAELLNKLKSLKKNDILVLAGSIPEGLSDTVYADILNEVPEGVRVIVDATKDVLRNTLKYHPFLIKPNTQELSEMFDVCIGSKKDALIYAEKLKQMGALNVIVSMGADGAVMVDEFGKKHMANAPDGKVISSVGAGDSMVAGFIKSVCNGYTYDEVLAYAVATGSATAFSEEMADAKLVDTLYAYVETECV